MPRLIDVGADFSMDIPIGGDTFTKNADFRRPH